jgi:hypothetical protein
VLTYRFHHYCFLPAIKNRKTVTGPYYKLNKADEMENIKIFWLKLTSYQSEGHISKDLLPFKCNWQKEQHLKISSGVLKDTLFGLGNMFKQATWRMSPSQIHRIDLGVSDYARKSGTSATDI